MYRILIVLIEAYILENFIIFQHIIVLLKVQINKIHTHNILPLFLDLDNLQLNLQNKKNTNNLIHMLK